MHTLVSQQRLLTEDESIAVVYKPTPKTALAIKQGAEQYVPVSPEGAAIRSHVRQPIMNRRPVGYQRDILGRLLVDLSWASSRLEGNTYSRLDTQNLIEFGEVAQGKEAIETQMILNHKAAIEMLIEGANEANFDTFTFKNLHAILSQDLMSNPDAPGRLRRRPVDISGTVCLPVALPQLIEDHFQVLLNKAAVIPDPFEQAFF